MNIGEVQSNNSMSYIYILKSEKTERYYIGSTSDPEKRLQEHNSGKTKSLVGHRPLVLVFKQKFANNVEARKMEFKLKKFKNRKIIDRIVREQNIIMGL